MGLFSKFNFNLVFIYLVKVDFICEYILVRILAWFFSSLLIL